MNLISNGLMMVRLLILFRNGGRSWRGGW